MKLIIQLISVIIITSIIIIMVHNIFYSYRTYLFLVLGASIGSFISLFFLYNYLKPITNIMDFLYLSITFIISFFTISLISIIFLIKKFGS